MPGKHVLAGVESNGMVKKLFYHRQNSQERANMSMVLYKNIKSHSILLKFDMSSGNVYLINSTAFDSIR